MDRAKRQTIAAFSLTLQDESLDWEARSKAAEALGKTGSEDAVTPLAQALQALDSGVRKAVVGALAKIGGEQARAFLTQALQDTNWVVRWHAAEALGESEEELQNAITPPPRDSSTQETETQAARANLELILQGVDCIPIKHLRVVSYSMLARGFARIGDSTHVQTLHQRAHKECETLTHLTEEEQLIVRGWITLYLGVAAPSDADRNQLHQAYQTIIERLHELRGVQLHLLEKIKASLEARSTHGDEATELPFEGFEEENFRCQYPSNQNHSDEPIGRFFAEFARYGKSSQSDELLNTASEALNHIAQMLQQGKQRARDLAWLLHVTVESIAKAAWDPQAAGAQSLGAQFEALAQTLPAIPAYTENSKTIERFYYALLRLNLAKGLRILRREEQAEELILSTLAWVRDSGLVPLDFIDLCAESLRFIEGAKLHHRDKPISYLVIGLLKQMTGAYASAYAGMNFAEYVLCLIDLTIEATLRIPA